MNTEKGSKRALKTSPRNTHLYTDSHTRVSMNTVIIDYPQEDEVITSQHYTFRMSAAISAVKVDVSIDGGNWQPCRKSQDHWWFDWENYKSKNYAMHARLHSIDGGKHFSSLRRFVVKLKQSFM